MSISGIAAESVRPEPDDADDTVRIETEPSLVEGSDPVTAPTAGTDPESSENPLESTPSDSVEDTTGDTAEPEETVTPASAENPTEGASTLAPDEQENQQQTETGTTTIVEPPVDAFLDALVSKIQPVKKNARKNFKILIYSEPGHGKTTLMGQAPNNLIIDVEDGLISLNNHPDLIPDSVMSVKHKSFAGLEAIVDRLNKNVPQLAHIETLSVDSVSELHKRGLGEVLDRNHAANAANNRYAAETEQHTENNEHIRRLVSSMRDLDRNLILLAHSRTIEPKGMPPKTFPDFSEKLANTLAGIVDVVAFLYLRKNGDDVERVIRFHSNGSIVAKTRVGGFPEEMVDPTWDKIYSIFQKALPLEPEHS